MKKLAVAFTGISNSGKTTLITKISYTLQQKGFKVAIIKHDPHDKAIFDTQGKDSWKFYQTGAEVAVLSNTRTTIFKRSYSSIQEIANYFSNFDYLLVEGLKTLPLPRICVVRNKIDSNYFDISDTLAVDFNSININDLPKNIKILNLNDIETIISWIDNNAIHI